MVFAPRPNGPYTITSPRTATDEYGAYKIRCEDAVWQANPDAIVARLGYQIDPDGIGNNMVAHTDAQQAADGMVRASTQWIPACAFLDDTAAALLSLVCGPPAGPAPPRRQRADIVDARAHPAKPRSHARTAVADRRDG